MGGVEYQVTKVDPTDPETKGVVYQVHKVSEEIAATLGGKVYRARIIKDPTEPTVAGKVYQIVLIDDPDDPAVKGKVYNAILTGGSEAVVVGPAVSPLALDDAVAGDLDYVIAFGGTEQNGTPTPDAPVDIVSNNGTIKFSLNEANYTADNVVLGYWLRNSDGQPESSSANFYTNMMPVKPNVSYVCFGRNKETNTISGYNRIAWYDANGVWIRNSTYTANTPGIDVSPSNAAFARFHCNINSTPVTQELVDSYNWVFQQGTAEVPYVPYVEGGFYTDGTVETIGVHGKNLFNQALFNTDVANTITYTTFEIPNGTYTMSTNFPYVGGATNVFVFAGEVTSGASTPNNGVYNGQDRTITVLDGKYTVAYRSRTSDASINTKNPKDYDFQLELGSTATPYTPYYNGGTATAEMLLKVGDYQDEQEILSGVVTRKVGVKVLDGTETFTVSSSGAMITQIPDVAIGATNNPINTHFALEESSTSIDVGKQRFGANGTQIYSANYYMKPLTSTTVSNFKQWLADQYAAGTPVIVVYPLADPTTESVAGQTLQVTDGDNTLEITQASLDNLELEAEYEKEAQ